MLAAANVTCSDLLTNPGTGNIALTYGGDSTIVLGSVVGVSATAAAGSAAIADARFRFASSDSSIVSVRGDSLHALRLGTVTITASLVGSLLPSTPPADSLTVTVVPGSVTLDSATVQFNSIGDTVRMGISVLDGVGNPVSGVAVSWVSTDPTRADVTPVGRIAARANGTTLVIATASGRSDTVAVAIQQVLAHYTFNVPGVGLNALTQTAQVTATPRDARGNAIAAGAAPSYVVHDPSVASVTAGTGLVTALLNGSTFVVAFRGAVRDSVPLLVSQKAKVVTVSPQPVPAMTSVGDQRQLNATAVDSANVSVQGAQPAWSSSNTAAANVNSAGLVTAVGLGSTFVVASLDGKRDSVVITVTNDPATVRVIPDTATATSINDTLVFTAAVLNTRGDPLASPLPVWRTPTTDTAIVTVLSDGRVIAKRTGAARIIAQAGAKADTGIAVVTNVPALIDITPTARTLTSLADADTPAVVIQNARGDALPRNSVAWTSDDASIARVNALGVVTAVDTGVTTIRARFGFVEDSVAYTIQNVPVSVSILLPPRSGAITSTTDTLTAIGQSLAMTVDVRNKRLAGIPNYPVVWVSTDRSVIDTVDQNVAVASGGFGTSSLIVTAGTVADTVRITVRNLTRIVVDNSVIANPRVGTGIRPFATIQDAVNAADASDTVLVKKGSGPYRETVALTKRLILLGDSSLFNSSSVPVAQRNNPLNLPLIAHDTGAAGITAITSAPQTIRYFAVRHTLDGPALDANGSDVAIDNLYVNPAGTTTSRIGRGISVKNSLSGTSIVLSTVDSVRGYGLRLESVSNATVRLLTVIGVDSLPGVEEGAGIKLVSGNGASVKIGIVRGAVIGVLVTGATNARVDSSIIWRNAFGMQINGGTTASVGNNNVFDNDSLGLLNPVGTNLPAANNWWGDARGPRLTAVPAATGDSVLGNVTFNAVRATPIFPGSGFSSLRIVRGNNQIGVHGIALAKAFTVRVTDANGFPVAAANVTFTVASGGGNLGGPTTQVVASNASGLAEVTLTLGAPPGSNTVTASVTPAAGGTVTVTFTATGS
jgi:hypothetical protein